MALTKTGGVYWLSNVPRSVRVVVIVKATSLSHHWWTKSIAAERVNTGGTLIHILDSTVGYEDVINPNMIVANND